MGFYKDLFFADKKDIAILTLIFLGTACFVKMYKNYLKSILLALTLPGPPAWPVLGNVCLIRDTEALLEIGDNMSKLYTPILRAWIFIVPIFLIYEPEHLKIILGNSKMSDKNFFYRVMHTFIGDGLITSTGNRWRKNRRLLQPCFQANLLENYVQDFAEISDEMFKQLYSQKTVHITKIINKCVLKILHKTILGVRLEQNQDTPFRRGELLIIKRVLKPWLLLDTIFRRSSMYQTETKQSNELHAYVKKVLTERLIERKFNKVSRYTTCLLDQLIDLSEISSSFTECDILNETVTFMLAGQDSVGTAIAFCLYHLAKYQEIQEKVFKELNDILFDEENVKTLTAQQLNQMHYLEQCIKETMRLLPSIPLIARVTTADVTVGGYAIPRGTNLFISPYTTHRLSHIFPDPLKFDPDRFSQEKLRKLHSYAYIPFSMGPRNCIGYKFAYLEMKTIIACIIKNYHISLHPNSENLKLSYRVTLRSKGGIWLNIKPRQGRYID